MGYDIARLNFYEIKKDDPIPDFIGFPTENVKQISVGLQSYYKNVHLERKYDLYGYS